MKRNLLRKGLYLLIAGLIIAGSQKMQHQPEAPEFVLSYAENQSEDYPTTQGAYRFARLVEERTEGRIKIMVQAQGTLGCEKQVIEQLQFGGIDFARVSLAELAEFIPKYTVLQMPYLYKNADHMWQVLGSWIGDEFLEEAGQADLVGLSWYDAGARNFYNKVRPITCLEDMKGMRIRVQESEMMADAVKALGATAVPIVYDEVYSSLEQDIIDGAENNWPSYESMGHYEVAGYYTIDEHVRIPEIQLCSQATWDKLTSQDQEIIRECARKSAEYEKQLWNEQEKEAQQKAASKGASITILSQEERENFQQAMKEIYVKYCLEDKDLIEAIVKMGE